MSRSRQNETRISLVAPSDSINLFMDKNKKKSENVRESSVTESPKYTIRANSSTNLLAYRTTISLRSCDNLNATKSYNSLELLVKVTDLILLLGAVIIVISLCITFSTVGLALFRMYSSEGVSKINNTRKSYNEWMLIRNETRTVS